MTLTEFPKMEQGSPEWFDARRGIVTASVVGKLVTTSSPDATLVRCPVCHAEIGGPCLSMAAKKSATPIKTMHDVRWAVAAEELAPAYEVATNDAAKAHIGTLVAERVAGFTEDTPMTSDMWRGVTAEPVARDLYSSHYAAATEVGFMRFDGDGWTLGYSPDGLVGDDGLIEIKAPRARTHLRTILADEVPAHYMAQCQAGLLVTGRAWLDFVSYCGGMPLFVKRVFPDPAWRQAIIAACVTYEDTAAEMVANYRERTANLPTTERIDNDLDLVF